MEAQTQQLKDHIFSSNLFFLLSHGLEVFLLLSLFFRLFDEKSYCLAVHNLFDIENFVEVLLELFSSALDVLGAFVCDAKDFFLREMWEIFNFTFC